MVLRGNAVPIWRGLKDDARARVDHVDFSGGDTKAIAQVSFHAFG